MHPALPALLDRLVPPDDFPGAVQNGVANFWQSLLDADPARREREEAALDALEAEAAIRFGADFAALEAAQQDAILHDLEANRARVLWPISPRDWLHGAAHRAAEGFYADPSNGANLERESWRMVGFRRTIERPLVQENLLPRTDPSAQNAASTSATVASTSGAPQGAASSVPAGNVAAHPGDLDRSADEIEGAASTSAASATQRAANVSRHAESWDGFDAIVVGSGAGGGAVACTLAEAGLRVLILERGRDLRFDDVPRDHIRSQRQPIYGHNAGPDADHPRVTVSPNGREATVLPWQGGYHNNAACVGGGTRVYGAQAWRFMPADFEMASRYGVPEGSSLSDWPLSYADLEPWYELAERDLGVCGDGHAMNAAHAPRASDFPLPPLGDIKRTPILRGAAGSLGWPTFPVPLAIASREYRGRRACVRCTECVGFACPSGAKAGSHNTHLPRALAKGATLLTSASAAEVIADVRGQACGVEFLARENASTSWRRVRARAKIIVVACGAIESARLLLLSKSDRHPNGIGNANGMVGRNLQGHVYTGAFGVHADAVHENTGPGPSIATNRWSHSSEAQSERIVGGGMLADDFLKPPVDFWKSALPPGLKRWGSENKDWMRQNYARTLQVFGPVHDIPSPLSRVQLDPTIRDAWGLPVARLSGTTHAETVRTANFLRTRAEEWLRAAGCERTWSHEVTQYLSGGQHQAGTCRMSRDKSSGVCDPLGRVHGQENLWVLDGSLHPTNGGFNPFLTITALALRGANAIVRAR